MVDKFKLTDNPKTWRIRNNVDVPKEYLDVLKINGYRMVILTVLSVIWGFIVGYSIHV